MAAPAGPGPDRDKEQVMPWMPLLYCLKPYAQTMYPDCEKKQ